MYQITQTFAQPLDVTVAPDLRSIVKLGPQKKEKKKGKKEKTRQQVLFVQTANNQLHTVSY